MDIILMMNFDVQMWNVKNGWLLLSVGACACGWLAGEEVGLLSVGGGGGVKDFLMDFDEIDGMGVHLSSLTHKNHEY